jgi:hypothetical protein
MKPFPVTTRLTPRMNTPRLPLLVSVAFATLLFAACESGPDRKALVDEVRHSVPPMAANDAFFDGQIIARITLGGNAAGAAILGGHEGFGHSSKMTAFKGNEGESNFGSTGGSAADGGFAGSGGAGGYGPTEMQESHDTSQDVTGRTMKTETYQGNQGMNHIADDEDAESPAARRARESQMPPALLRMQLENTGGATMVVEIKDMNSDLGNFAIRPDTVTLKPGEAVEVEPMQSLLGVDSYAIPVTITLRAAGQTQTRILTLRPVLPPAGTAAPATPPAAARPPGN